MSPQHTGGRRGLLLSYCLYDMGSSAFTTIIVTVVYSVYFRTHVAGGHAWADLYWGLAASSAMLIVALAAPVLGARADRYGSRHRYLIGFTLLSVAATAALASVGQGDVLMGLVLFVAGHVGFAASEAFYNAFLPDVAEPHRLGFVSGLSWGVGYLGGLLSLGLAFVFVGGSSAAHSPARTGHALLFLAVAAQYLLFAVPALLLLRDRRGPATSTDTPLQRLARTARELKRFRQVLRFLIAYFLYDNGLSVVIFFTAIYMNTTIGFSMTEILALFVFLQITAAAGALVSGQAADRFSPRVVVLITLVLWIGVLVAMANVTSRAAFGALALVGGLGIGSTQACSRTLLAQLVPQTKRAEFFGFFAFCTKASGIVGPALFGILSGWMQSQRLALLSTLFFFVSGLILLALVDEREGRRTAAEYSETYHPTPA